MKYIKKFELSEKQNNDNDHQLAVAVHRNKIDLVREAINKGANPNKLDDYKNHLIFVAIFNANMEILKELISAGADLNCQNVEGDTPLIVSAKNIFVYNRAPLIIQELINAGADWNIKNNKGEYFFDNINKGDVRERLIEEYPEKYKEYLFNKKLDKFNL